MERHAKTGDELHNAREERRLNPAIRLFLAEDIEKYVDVDLYEEDFYAKTQDLTSYFHRKPVRKTEQPPLQDPAFFSVYQKTAQSQVSFDDEDSRRKAQQAGNTLKVSSYSQAALEEENKNDVLIDVSEPDLDELDWENLYDEDDVSQSEKLSEPIRKAAAASGNKAYIRKAPYKPVKAKAKKKQRTKAEKQRIGITISLITTFVLLLGLVAGYILAYKFSDNKTYVLKRDQSAPEAKAVDRTIFSYETLTPEDLVSDIKDDTAVTIAQLDDIDYSTGGEQSIRIRLTDEAGNENIVTAVVNVIRDETAPTIVCEPLVHVTTGQSVAYKSFVVVRDDFDEEPEITVDNSQVDLSREGKYPLSYKAVDKSGNETTKTCEIEVSHSNGYVEEEDVWALVDATLSYIVDDSMDDIHKVWAVYEYVRNIPYVLTDFSYDYMYEGYKILHDNKGDCYGSFAASKLLLDRLGIDNIPIETSSNGNHFWNMVSLDGGQTWYHFDATRWTQWGDNRPVMCMISSDELYRISEEHLGTHRYDAAAYPATPAESMPVPEDIVEIYGYDY